MLKLERIKNKREVELRVQKTSVFFDPVLLRALFFSACIHLLFLASFRIKYFEFHEVPSPHPINVLLDLEHIDAPQAIVEAGQENDIFFFTHDLETENDLARSLAYTQTVLDSDIAKTSEELSYHVRSYPLKLKLSKSLKSLKILDDGSSLFKEKARITTALPPSNHYQIEYQVEVDRKSGTLVELSRKKELLDKQLQEIADRIIRMISFAKGKEMRLKGTITLDFFYNGEEIQDFLEKA